MEGAEQDIRRYPCARSFLITLTLCEVICKPDLTHLGGLEVARLLLDRSAAARSNVTRPGPTMDLRYLALMCSAEGGHLEVVRLLLDHSADPNQARKSRRLGESLRPSESAWAGSRIGSSLHGRILTPPPLAGLHVCRLNLRPSSINCSLERRTAPRV